MRNTAFRRGGPQQAQLTGDVGFAEGRASGVGVWAGGLYTASPRARDARTVTMCILILLRGVSASHPIVVGANRDERRDRTSAPPGLWVGERHRILSPRDRVAGGTWLAIDDRGWFAGITNLVGEPAVPGAPSRGHLPHLALDQFDLDAGVAAVRSAVEARPHSGFQLVVCDGRRTMVVVHRAGRTDVRDWPEKVLVVTNEHGPGELVLPGLGDATAPSLDVDRRLDALAVLLRDSGDGGRHPTLKKGTDYGTVSSSLIAVPAAVATGLVWRYAAGAPDTVPYRSYGNLGRRLLPEPAP